MSQQHFTAIIHHFIMITAAAVDGTLTSILITLASNIIDIEQGEGDGRRLMLQVVIKVVADVKILTGASI